MAEYKSFDRENGKIGVFLGGKGDKYRREWKKGKGE